MPQFGIYTLYLTFVLLMYSLIVCVRGVIKKDRDLNKSGRRAVYAVFWVLTISSGILLHALITRNFRIEYVANYTSSDLPLFYTISAFWAGQKGSLLLWVWLLTAFNALVAFFHRKDTDHRLVGYVLAIMSGIELFFVILLIFVTNPFETLNFLPVDGQGLNPLLQNPGMTWHPPTLFIGYVGLTIPFAYAIGALFLKELDDSWIKATRRWTTFSWFFLTLGIILGCQWAYVELGWGGYWAWDPVENASIMPWFTASAFLHSVMIQEKRDMLKIWNVTLISLTFLLTIFGTFITRSGVVSSVHAFGKSNLGPFFVIFMASVAGMVIYLITDRRKLLGSTNELDSFLSKESTFLLNNLILVSLAFATLWGTIFPLVSEAVKGVKITVGPPFFNQVNVPLGLTLLILMGICPLISWQKSSWDNFKRNFFKPSLVTLIASLVLFFMKIRNPFVLISFSFCIFVLVIIIMEFYRGTRARHKKTDKNYFYSFFTLIWKNKKRYGGYIVHIGVVLIYIGITGSSAYTKDMQIHVQQGDVFSIGEYTLKYEGMTSYPTRNKDVVSATLTISKKGKSIYKLIPEKYYYSNKEQPTTEVAILSTFKNDLYVILAGYDHDMSATFKVYLNPLIIWIWIGTFIIFIGVIIVLYPDRKKRRLLAADTGGAV